MVVFWGQYQLPFQDVCKPERAYATVPPFYTPLWSPAESLCVTRQCLMMTRLVPSSSLA